ncbi:MAG: FtsX-like permease family protein [Clostridia bacterium]|nr:FtsX-like permease family protein [Clostridia bacterium]
MDSLLLKSTFRTIGRNFGRFVAILLIVATGLAFFSGVKAAGPDMLATAKKYYDDYNLMDIRVQSNIGLTAADAQAISGVSGVDYVMPQKFVDALVRVNGEVESDIDGAQISTRAYGIDLSKLSTYATGVRDPAFINRPELLEGRYPVNENECLVDQSRLSTPDSYRLGSVITLEGDDDSIEDSLSVTDFTIVGVIRSPYYVSFERGNSLVGSGKIGTYIYIPDSVITNDYYSEIYVTVSGAQAYEPYSDKYFDYIRTVADRISAMETERLTIRAAQLNAEIPPIVANAQTQLNALLAQSDAQFSQAEAQIAQLESLAANGDSILAAAEAEYNQKFSEQTTRLSNSQNEYAQQVNTYNQLQSYVIAAETEYNAKLTEYNAKQAEYNQKKVQADTATTQITTAEQQLAQTQNLLDRTTGVMNSLIASQGVALNQDDIQNIVGVFQAINPELYNAIFSLTAQGMAVDAMALIQPQIDEYKAQIQAQQQQLDAAKQLLSSAQTELSKAEQELNAGAAELTAARSTLDNYEAQLSTARTQLEAYGDQIQSGGYQLSLAQLQAQQQIAQLRMQVQSADTTLETAKKELAEKRADVDAKIKYAQTVISRGTKSLAGIATAKWYVYDRSDTPGYTGYGSAASNVNTLSYVFPLFFIVVAVMVSLSTMTRMVADERTQIGTLKALGYKNGQIGIGYVLYAFFAGFLGSVLGTVIGIYYIPQAIAAAYGIMFEMPDVIIQAPISTIAIGFALFCLMSIPVSLWAVRRELGVVPAILMRAKAPKSGKRILLERVRFIWRRLSFTTKVTIRNTFRAPKRTIMTLISVTGCTALLLAGFGMRDSVGAIMDKQFGKDGISMYDMQIVFDEPQNPQSSSVLDSVTREPGVSDVLLTSMTALTGSSERVSGSIDVYVLVPAKPVAIGTMLRLRDIEDHTLRAIDDSGAIITEKYAKFSKTNVGDHIQLTTADNRTADVIVSGIVENYVFDYVYMTPTVYTAVFGEEPVYHYALARLTDEVLAAAENNTNPDAVNPKTAIADDISGKVGVTAVAFTSATVDTFNEVVKAITYVVLIFIVAAAVLEVVVLYNLANVNILERLREIATLKVLGFYDSEVSAYIYRENIIFTVIGALLGLVGGFWLHKLMLNYIVVDSVTYGKTINPLSYVIAFAATVILSLLVNFMLRRKLQSVSMVESFKSID